MGLPMVMLAKATWCTGGCWGEWVWAERQIRLKQGTFSSHLASPIPAAWGSSTSPGMGKGDLKEVRRCPFAKWSSNILLFKRSERQYGILLRMVLLRVLMQDLMLIYPNAFSHHSGSVLKGHFTCKVSFYCQRKVKGLWQMKTRLKSKSLALILINLSPAD